jgi:hypothetical protein
LIVKDECSQPGLASLNCNTDCPIDFRQAAPSTQPMQGYFERESCLAGCQQANSQEYELQQQTDEMKKQTKLLKQQVEEQQAIKNELEEQREELDELRSNQEFY